jgi:hypothetical protein
MLPRYRSSGRITRPLRFALSQLNADKPARAAARHMPWLGLRVGDNADFGRFGGCGTYVGCLAPGIGIQVSRPRPGKLHRMSVGLLLTLRTPRAGRTAVNPGDRRSRAPVPAHCLAEFVVHSLIDLDQVRAASDSRQSHSGDD